MSRQGKWIRTCNECGNEQTDKQPEPGSKLSNAYCDRICKQCKSPALDYGTTMYKAPNESWDDYYKNNPDTLEHDDFTSDFQEE